MESVPESYDAMFYRDKPFDLRMLQDLMRDFQVSRKPTSTLQEVISSSDVNNTDPDSWVSELIRPEDPPLTNSFTGTMFYTRDCYLVYYEIMMECLDSGRYECLTLCGSPGSGKSLFYLYTFNRFRRENPSATIVTAAFYDDCVMKECWVYTPGEERKKHDKIPRIHGAIYLFDGPPSGIIHNEKVICFTRPVPRWTFQQKLISRHTCLWFPMWDLDELLDANDVCKLNLSKETLSERYDLFGGSARYCLSKEDGLVDGGHDQLRRQAARIDSFAMLHMSYEDANDDSNDILHIRPQIDDRFPFISSKESRICSRAVDGMICFGIWGTYDEHELFQRAHADYREFESRRKSMAALLTVLSKW